MTQHSLGKLNVLKELQGWGQKLRSGCGRLPSPQGTYLGRAELQQTSGPHIRVSLIVQSVKALPAMQETGLQSLDREDPLEKETATHSSILAWRIPWMEEPGGLWPIELQRIGQE